MKKFRLAAVQVHQTSVLLLGFVMLLGIQLPHPANAESLSCAGVVIETKPGSTLSDGAAGTADGIALPAGSVTSWDVLRRCSNDQSPCVSAENCAGGECVQTCDCLSNTSCELTGPVHGRKCLSTLQDCTTNSDCPSSAACVHLFAPPAPLPAGGTPFCSVLYFDGAASGTLESASGDVSLSATLRQRLFLGTAVDHPCPRCGAPGQSPQVGDIFTCEGGQFPGAACVVEGVTADFGGTSSDCPPAAADNITGLGLTMRLNDLTTGSSSRTAALPCSAVGFQGNPLSPGSNPKCTDNTAGPVCTSNADCTRCTGDPAVVCANNGDCTGKGTCAQAPEQPITCGFWCHCGFCDNNGSLPCSSSSECPNGQACVKGTGSATSANAPQQRPNGCSSDGFRCGVAESERCENTEAGSCSLAPYRSCASDATCETASAGTCVFADRTCFEPRIERSGAPSPLGTYCAYEDKTCVSNADCTGADDFCVSDASRPRMVATLCLPASLSNAINSAFGITGPGTVELDALVRVCRCGTGEPQCDDVCGAAATTTTLPVTTTLAETTTTLPVTTTLPATTTTVPLTTTTLPVTTTTLSVTTTTLSVTTTTLEVTTTTLPVTTTTLPVTTTTLAADCGDGAVTGDETCDDGDTAWASGQYCNAMCQALACGDPNDSKTITTTDSLFALRASVGSVTCSVRVCDANGNGSTTASDALLILKKSVGQAVTLMCT